jgi:hypothetical protein
MQRNTPLGVIGWPLKKLLLRSRANEGLPGGRVTRRYWACDPPQSYPAVAARGLTLPSTSWFGSAPTSPAALVTRLAQGEDDGIRKLVVGNVPVVSVGSWLLLLPAGVDVSSILVNVNEHPVPTDDPVPSLSFPQTIEA